MYINSYGQLVADDYLAHYGILGMHWGIRRYQPYPGDYRGDGKYAGAKAKYKNAKLSLKAARKYAKADKRNAKILKTDVKVTKVNLKDAKNGAFVAKDKITFLKDEHKMARQKAKAAIDRLKADKITIKKAKSDLKITKAEMLAEKAIAKETAKAKRDAMIDAAVSTGVSPVNFEKNVPSKYVNAHRESYATQRRYDNTLLKPKVSKEYDAEYRKAYNDYLDKISTLELKTSGKKALAKARNKQPVYSVKR